jgi:hypothetical protein
MSAPAPPLGAVACVDDAGPPFDLDAPDRPGPSLLPLDPDGLEHPLDPDELEHPLDLDEVEDPLDLDEVDVLLKRSVEARLVAVAAIAETRYTCEVADLMLERLQRPGKRARR